MITNGAETTVDRVQLQTIIGELDDGIVIIEAEGIISSANASALRMHGIDSVSGLGGSIEGYHGRFGLSYRNNHVLSESEYPGQRALQGETIRDVLVNVTRRGETGPSWTHKVRSLIVDATGEGPGFCVLIIDDATEEVNAEARFEKAFAANPAPAVICRLEDLRYIKVNLGFLAMTGYRREEVIGHSVFEIDVLETLKSEKWRLSASTPANRSHRWRRA